MFAILEFHKPQSVNNTLEALCDVMKIESLMSKKISELSTGELRKVEVSSLYQSDKCIFIYDEISNGLDKKSTIEILSFIKQYHSQNPGVIGFYTSHNLIEIEQISANKCWVFMGDGEIQEVLSPDYNTIQDIYNNL